MPPTQTLLEMLPLLIPEFLQLKDTRNDAGGSASDLIFAKNRGTDVHVGRDLAFQFS